MSDRSPGAGLSLGFFFGPRSSHILPAHSPSSDGRGVDPHRRAVTLDGSGRSPRVATVGDLRDVLVSLDVATRGPCLEFTALDGRVCGL